MNVASIDLDAEDTALGALPRMRRAAFYARRLRVLWVATGVLALLLLAAARFAPNAVFRVVLINNGAALLLLALGLQSAHCIARWRVRAGDGHVAARTDAEPEQRRPWLWRVRTRALKMLRLARGLLDRPGAQAAWMAILCLLVLTSIRSAWRLDLSAVPPGIEASVGAGAALMIAFAVLVLERYCAGRSSSEWPEHAALAQLARLVLLVLLPTALCLFLSNGERLWPARVLVLMGAVPFAVATELLLKAVLSPFAPQSERREPGLLADSVLAGLLRWPLRPLQTLQDELQQRFGIDLRQNWAFAFMRRAVLPVLAFIAALGWALTSIREIAIDGRGIYERFGKPVAVWQPGLHVGLPWPFGRVRALENGVVRELAVTTAADLDKRPALDEGPSDADGPAPDAANRLWDGSHTAEKSQVIASRSGDRQSFHIVNMDVRLIYRVGLSDQAALAATYASTDREALLRSTAAQILVRKFASRTLDEVLGEQRVELGKEISAEIQSALNGAGSDAASGVEILSVIVESIHPPAGAANAYHSVQAAQIRAQALIARERGRAAEQIHLARTKASMGEDKAQAQARETHAGAQAAQLRYAAEKSAYRAAGKAFAFEHYLSQLTQGVSGGRLIVIDHRIGAGGYAPTIDLRSYTAPIDASPARSGEP